jgi:hypothetical protein
MTRYVREDVAHVWAHQLQDSARNKTGNLYFNGSTIYSYGSHFPIAKHVEHKGKKCILFTTRDYSSTTSGHKCEVSRAIPPGVPVFHINIGGDRILAYNGAPGREVLKEYVERIANLSREIAKGRDGWRQKQRQADLVKLVDEANAFSKFFGLRKTFTAPTDMDAIRAQVKREAELLKRRKAAEQKRLEAKQAEALESWLVGGDKWPFGLEHDHLRVYENDDGSKSVQTTRHVVVPLKDVKKVAKLVLRHVKSGEHWQTNGQKIQVGDYFLSAITSDGTVHVGCHKFKRDEILRFAGVLGLA